MGHLLAAAPLPVVARLVAFVVDALTAALAAADVELWACDGCALVGSESEVEAHLQAGFWAADGSLREWADVSCHGSMLVGGPAWEAWTFHGVHPMTVLAADIADLARRHGVA